MINTIDSSGQTALHIAVSNNNFQLAEELVKNGANVNLINLDDQTVMHIAVTNGKLKFIKFLIANSNIDLDAQDKYGQTVLHIEVSKKIGNFKIIKLLLECCINKNAKDKNGCTALHIAALNNHNTFAKMILGNNNFENKLWRSYDKLGNNTFENTPWRTYDKLENKLWRS